jgi:hypothetical protein
MIKLITKLLHLKKKDVLLEDAITFMKKQKKLNLANINKIKDMGFNTDDMTYWNDIYDFIITILKSMRK